MTSLDLHSDLLTCWPSVYCSDHTAPGLLVVEGSVVMLRPGKTPLSAEGPGREAGSDSASAICFVEDCTVKSSACFPHLAHLQSGNDDTQALWNPSPWNQEL